MWRKIRQQLELNLDYNYSQKKLLEYNWIFLQFFL